MLLGQNEPEKKWASVSAIMLEEASSPLVSFLSIPHIINRVRMDS